MAFEALYFDSVAGDRVYDSSDWERIYASLVNDGIVPGFGDEMLVSESLPAAMDVRVGTGRLFANGKFGELKSSFQTLTIQNNGSGNPRRDLVVARIDYGSRIGELAVKQGTPGTTPTAPTVQQDSSTYEVALAEVFVANGAVQVNDDDITDVRTFATSPSAVPRGVVTMWSGSANAVPLGWALCNGTNGTPDLRDRFVVGAGGAYTSGDTGGQDTVTLTAAQMPTHTHTGPSHDHGVGTLALGNDSHSHTANSAGSHNHDDKGSSIILNAPTQQNIASGSNHHTSGAADTGSNGAHTHSTTTDTHSHSISGKTAAAGTGNTGSAGSGQSHENRPPYFALAFIMKV